MHSSPFGATLLNHISNYHIMSEATCCRLVFVTAIIQCSFDFWPQKVLFSVLDARKAQGDTYEEVFRDNLCSNILFKSSGSSKISQKLSRTYKRLENHDQETPKVGLGSHIQVGIIIKYARLVIPSNQGRPFFVTRSETTTFSLRDKGVLLHVSRAQEVKGLFIEGMDICLDIFCSETTDN